MAKTEAAGKRAAGQFPSSGGPATQAITNEGLTVRVPERAPTANALKEPPKLPIDNMEARRVGDPFPGTVEHKSVRWQQYQERGGQLSYEKWSAKYEVSIQQARKANAAVDAYHAKIGWGKREVTIEVEPGVTRRLDIADEAAKKGIEHKTGNQSLNDELRWEIERDAKLVKIGWDIEWRFDGAASKPLLAALENAGIRYSVGGIK
jgi:hypothetical protein